MYLYGKKLPIAVKTLKYVEYEEIELSRTQNDMHSIALNSLNQRINNELRDSEILSKSISFIEGDDSLTLICNLKCISNISESRPLM